MTMISETTAARNPLFGLHATIFPMLSSWLRAVDRKLAAQRAAARLSALDPRTLVDFGMAPAADNGARINDPRENPLGLAREVLSWTRFAK